VVFITPHPTAAIRRHFDAVVENLGATLLELGVPNDTVSTIAGSLEGLRVDVLDR
jgi:hemoglobin